MQNNLFMAMHPIQKLQCLVDHSEHVYYFVGISSPFMQFRWQLLWMLFNDAYFFLPLLSGCKESHFYSLPFGKLKLTLSPNIFSRSPKNVLMSRIDFTVLFLGGNFTKNFTCRLGKLRTEFTSPITKSTSPGLSYTTFFAHWLCIKIEGLKIVLILVYCNTDFCSLSSD